MNRDELIASNLGIAYGIAHETKSKLPSHVELDELVGDALHGLVAAAEAFDEERGLAFSTYARWRVRGFIIDGLRRRDVVGRRKGWDPDDPRLAPAIALDAPVADAGSPSLQSSIPDPSDAMGEFEDGDLVDWLLDRLPERERSVVMTLIWADDVSTAELADRRGVTVSRVSQIYNDGLHRMRLDLVECELGTTKMADLIRARIHRQRRLSSAERNFMFAAVGC